MYFWAVRNASLRSQVPWVPQHYMGIWKSGYAPRFQIPARYDGPREPPKVPFGRRLEPSITWGFGNLAKHSDFKFPHARMGTKSPQSCPLAAPWTPTLDGDSEIWRHTPVSGSCKV